MRKYVDRLRALRRLSRAMERRQQGELARRMLEARLAREAADQVAQENREARDRFRHLQDRGHVAPLEYLEELRQLSDARWRLDRETEKLRRQDGSVDEARDELRDRSTERRGLDRAGERRLDRYQDELRRYLEREMDEQVSRRRGGKAA